MTSEWKMHDHGTVNPKKPVQVYTSSFAACCIATPIALETLVTPFVYISSLPRTAAALNVPAIHHHICQRLLVTWVSFGTPWFVAPT